MPSLANGRTLRDRLFSRLLIDPETGCLNWAGGLDESGYGVIRADGRNRKVHRVMYEMFSGPVPAGLTLDHLCRNRMCANVAHLEPVTPWVNTMRGSGPAAVNAAKTHCPAGHAYDAANTHWYQGRRYCRACHSELTRSGNRRARAMRKDRQSA